MIYDLVIVGGGPAGLTAAIYASRASLKTIVFEKASCGGQIVTSPKVDNYPGMPHVSGLDFSNALESQAEELGAEIEYEEVISFEKKGENFKVVTEDGEYEARAIVLATGVAPKHLNIPGEESLIGCGISFCATCDGGFFKDKEVAVIGGGNTALDDAAYLADICSKVYLIHRRDEFRGNPATVKKLREKQNVEFVLSAIPIAVNGDKKLESLQIEQNGEKRELKLAGIFEAVGHAPQGAGLNSELKTDDYGYLVADENLQSSIPGVFLAGDLRQKRLRQLTTATADGSEVITSILEHLNK